MQTESMDKFATYRLIAERIRPKHFGKLGRLYSDPEVMQTLSADGNILPDKHDKKRS